MAETTNYMILGFSVIFGTIVIYVYSLIARLSRAEKDLAILQDLDEE